MKVNQVQDPFNFRAILNSNDYYNKNQQLRKEINSRKLVVDRSCFKQTKEDREKAFNLKEQNRRERKYVYGVGNYKKQLNIPANKILTPDGTNRIVLTH